MLGTINGFLQHLETGVFLDVCLHSVKVRLKVLGLRWVYRKSWLTYLCATLHRHLIISRHFPLLDGPEPSCTSSEVTDDESPSSGSLFWCETS